MIHERREKGNEKSNTSNHIHVDDTAFALIAALAWNQAIQAVILQILPKQSRIVGLFTYAIIITIIAVIATVLIARAISKPAVQEVRIVE